MARDEHSVSSIGDPFISLPSGLSTDEQFLDEISIKHLFDGLPGNFFVTNSDGMPVFCNQPQMKMYQALNTSDFKRAWSEADLDALQLVKANNEAVMMSKRPMVFEESVRIQGRRHYFVSHKAPIFHKHTNEVVASAAMPLT